MQGTSDPYAVPKNMGIFRMIESPKDITTSSVARRIIANHKIYKVFFIFLLYFSWILLMISHVCTYDFAGWQIQLT